MSEVKKWFVHVTRHGVKHIIDVQVPTDETAPLLTANGSGRRLDVETDAILRLAAAAPDMLAALKEIISQIDQGGAGGKVFSRDACIAKVRSAIAKATGGAK